MEGTKVLLLILLLVGLFMLLPWILSCSEPEKIQSDNEWYDKMNQEKPEGSWECCEDNFGVPFCFRVDEVFAKNRNLYPITYLENNDAASNTKSCHPKRKNK